MEAGVEVVLEEALARSRQAYDMLGREYRRVGLARGSAGFDDRSTAYAVTALSVSHTISDIAETLRYIWLRAGGVDSRKRLPIRGIDVLQLSDAQ